MCGIIGFVGKKAALPVLLAGLSALEYRGYDSAGVALADDNVQVIKSRGRLSLLQEKLGAMQDYAARCGIGHTRWATHGAPDDKNAHPHATKRLALVHNGIIENYAELGCELQKAGYRYRSETDTEIAACLIDSLYARSHDPVRALLQAAERLRGSYAFGVIFADLPGKIFALRKNNPLIVAKTGEGALISSDIPAILPYTRSYFRPEEGVVAELTQEEIAFFDQEGKRITQQIEHVEWETEQAQKEGWPHFMIKEIFEEPAALRKTVSRYVKNGLPQFDLQAPGRPREIERIHIVACGTAMHAGLIGRRALERLAGIPTFVEMASEFRYRDPILTTKDLLILLSQSGETADTLAALRLAKERGVPTLAVVNVVGSTVAREADRVFYTPAGPEIAVASTKAYSVQCAVLYLLALQLGQQRGCVTEQEARTYCNALLCEVPEAVEQVLCMNDEIRSLALPLTGAEHLFYIGRDVDYDLCVEGSLKLKEISYIHSEAYAAGELKHGTISLIEKGTPVVALLTAPRLAEKMISGIREVRARGAAVTAVVTSEIAAHYDVPADKKLILPPAREAVAPFSAVCALQLLAYHVAAEKGLDVDKPRNLAKSVTVE